MVVDAAACYRERFARLRCCSREGFLGRRDRRDDMTAGGHTLPMVQSGFHLAAREAPQSWRELRRRRSSPPVRMPVARAQTFQSALEQAEQQFRAAASVGYDSRPLNLFYGLSQAGRAVAAAASRLGPDDWALAGHGILARRLDTSADIGQVAIVTSSGRVGTSFHRLSTVLDSEIPDCTLGDVWACIYESSAFEPLDSAEIFVPLEVSAAVPAINSGQANWHAGASSANVILPKALGSTPMLTVHDYLAHYPALRGWDTVERQPSAAVWPEEGQPLTLYWEAIAEQGMKGLDGRRVRYRGQTYLAMPTIGRALKPVHPLMAWWAVLFGLSMLARYQPDRWTAMINIDQNPKAIAIEFLLDEALAAVPELIDQAIDAVS